MFTFNGVSKLIILDSGTTSFAVTDLYSRWKEWVILSDNAKFLPAFSSSLGGNALGGGAFLGQYYFIQNGWEVRPQEASHTLTVSGNLFPIPESADTFAPTLGSFNVQIVQQVSSLTQQVSTGGSTSPTVQQIRTELDDNSTQLTATLKAAKLAAALSA
tara:strand:+ start:151 stop:627 length:477 start_codon:yes stop_codon:yes gene_type:complete